MTGNPYSDMAQEIVQEVSQSVVKKTKEVSASLAKELHQNRLELNAIKTKLQKVPYLEEKVNKMVGILDQGPEVFERLEAAETELNQLRFDQQVITIQNDAISSLTKTVTRLENQLRSMKTNQTKEVTQEGGDTLHLEGSVVTAPVSTSAIEYHVHNHYPQAQQPSWADKLKQKFFSPSTALAAAEQVVPAVTGSEKKRFPWFSIVKITGYLFCGLAIGACIINIK